MSEPSVADLRAELLPLLAPFRDVEGALLPILHLVQERYGWISPDATRVVAEFLRVTPPQVYEVATYYHELSVQPPVDVRAMICAGPACRICGGPEVLAALEEATGLTLGDVSRDGRYGLTSSACLGVCMHAPAVAFNHRVVGRITPRAVPGLLSEAATENHRSPGSVGTGTSG